MVTTVPISVKLGLVHITQRGRGLEVGLAGIVLLCVCMCVFEIQSIENWTQSQLFFCPKRWFILRFLGLAHRVIWPSH